MGKYRRRFPFLGRGMRGVGEVGPRKLARDSSWGMEWAGEVVPTGRRSRGEGTGVGVSNLWEPRGEEAASPTRGKLGARGGVPKWETGEEEASQPVGREAATAGSRQKETHHSGPLGRRLRPAAGLHSAKVPGEKGTALQAEGARTPVSRPKGRRHWIPRKPEPHPRMPLLPPSPLARASEGRGAGRGGDRAAQPGVGAPWRRSSTGARCGAGAGRSSRQSRALPLRFRLAWVRIPPGNSLPCNPEVRSVSE